MGPSIPSPRERASAHPSLRRRLYGLTALLVLVALTTSAMLGFLTHEMRLHTDRLAAVLRDAHQVDVLRSELVFFERSRNFGAPGEPFEVAAREVSQRDERLAQLSVDSDPGLVAQLRAGVARYLERRGQAERQARPLPEIVAQAGPDFRAALAACDALSRQQQARARAIQALVVRWDLFTNVAGGVTAALFLAVVGIIVRLTQTSVFGPLFELREAIVRFGEGELGARLPVDAPAELAEVADRFNRMAEKLEQERERRLTFLAAVAHDMANPLMAMKMSAGLAKQRRPMSPEHWHELFDRVDRQVLRLQRMVGDLLDASRIEAGQLELRASEQDLRALVSEAVELHHPLPKEHRIELGVPEAPVWVRVDETRIAQVLNNLISNAIKYSPGGGTIRVRLESDGEVARLAVADEGIGIAPDELERVFEPFQRSQRVGEEIPGVGLGLSVVRRIVLAHEGSIRVRSAPGVGSTFIVSLPLAVRAAAEAQPPAEPAPLVH